MPGGCEWEAGTGDEKKWCPREDSNLHDLAATSS